MGSKTLEEVLAEEKEKAEYQLNISENDFNQSKGSYFKGKLKVIEIIEKKLKEVSGK